MQKEPTIRDVLDILQSHATHVDQQFAEIKKTMVTKTYLDERIADLRGDSSSEAYRQIRKHEVQYHSA